MVKMEIYRESVKNLLMKGEIYLTEGHLAVCFSRKKKVLPANLCNFGVPCVESLKKKARYLDGPMEVIGTSW